MDGTKKTQDKKPEKPQEAFQLQVTLVRKSASAYDVLGADGKRLRCRCGRPVEATLHNVSVKDRLEPCSRVVIKQNS